ncbi:MAG: hypothetical protein HW421_2864 [Ignavibacteria bacterium]|nr:hypothetical protein [Ignavibacteria bacterium]
MLLKEQVTETINSMPEQFEIYDFVDRLIFLDKIDQGLDDIKNDRVHTEEEAEQRLEKWLKYTEN